MSENPRNHLRQTLREARNALSKSHVRNKSFSICTQATRLVAESQHVAAYFAFGAEVDLTVLMTARDACGQKNYVPIVLPEHRMLFAPVSSDTPVTVNRYGIKEPEYNETSCIQGSQLDAVLVPLVGFDLLCNRMGMGGGYYDRCFARADNAASTNKIADNRPLLIGVAYELQCVDSVFPEDWDVPLDYVITESRIIQRKNNE